MRVVGPKAAKNAHCQLLCLCLPMITFLLFLSLSLFVLSLSLLSPSLFCLHFVLSLSQTLFFHSSPFSFSLTPWVPLLVLSLSLHSRSFSKPPNNGKMSENAQHNTTSLSHQNCQWHANTHAPARLPHSRTMATLRQCGVCVAHTPSGERVTKSDFARCPVSD